MLVIPTQHPHLRSPTRRELLRSGSIGLLGLNLAEFLALPRPRQRATNKLEGARGFAPPSPCS